MKTKQKRSKTTNPRKPVRCQYCGAVAVLRPASEIYGDEKRTDMLYVCGHYPACNAYVAVHPGTLEPMGPLANGDLRHLRIRAHRTFDQIWQRRIMSRQSAYGTTVNNVNAWIARARSRLKDDPEMSKLK